MRTVTRHVLLPDGRAVCFDETRLNGTVIVGRALPAGALDVEPAAYADAHVSGKLERAERARVARVESNGKLAAIHREAMRAAIRDANQEG